MNPHTKATLLSALVFPGLGQLTLKRYYRATLMISACLISLYIIINSAIEKAMEISQKIVSGEIPYDTTTISRMIEESSAGASASTTNSALSIVTFIWLWAMIDAYFINRMAEPVNEST